MGESIVPNIIVDVLEETCPIPLVEMRKAVMKAKEGQIIEVKGNHGPSKLEIPLAVKSLGLKLLHVREDEDGVWHIFIEK